MSNNLHISPFKGRERSKSWLFLYNSSQSSTTQALKMGMNVLDSKERISTEILEDRRIKMMYQYLFSRGKCSPMNS